MNKEHADFVVDVMAAFEAAGIQVFGERVAIIRDPAHEKTESGLLYIPEEGKRKEPRGTIVALGRNVDPDKDDIHRGDRVMYTKYSPIHFTINMPDGSKADVELFHISDIYLLWKGDDCA
jgi:co-chaperonin GroES (HSP10)